MERNCNQKYDLQGYLAQSTRELFQMASDESLVEKITKLENDSLEMKKNFQIVFDKINQLELQVPLLPKKCKRIGLKK